jgi:hypothetical protein
MQKQRRHFQQTSSLQNRLASFAKSARAVAALLPPGTEKDELLSKAQRADTAAQPNQWVNSCGLQPPIHDE